MDMFVCDRVYGKYLRKYDRNKRGLEVVLLSRSSLSHDPVQTAAIESVSSFFYLK